MGDIVFDDEVLDDDDDAGEEEGGGGGGSETDMDSEQENPDTPAPAPAGMVSEEQRIFEMLVEEKGNEAEGEDGFSHLFNVAEYHLIVTALSGWGSLTPQERSVRNRGVGGSKLYRWAKMFVVRQEGGGAEPVLLQRPKKKKGKKRSMAGAGPHMRIRISVVPVCVLAHARTHTGTCKDAYW